MPGVYALIGPAAALAGSALWLSFVLAGLVAALTASSYARLGAMRPKVSPEFQYTALAFGDDVGFIAGWLMLVGDIAAAASVALGFGGCLGHLLGTPTDLGAAGLVFAAGVAMYAGIGQSVAIAIALTLVEAAGLLLVIAVGAPSWPQVDLRLPASGLDGIFGAAALIFFAYLGFDELGNLAEEMRSPERDLSRALFVSLGVTTRVRRGRRVGAVNLGLVTLGVRRRTPGGPGAWARDAVVATAGTLMCGWLLWHGGVVWVVAAGAFALLGGVWLVVRRGGRGR